MFKLARLLIVLVVFLSIGCESIKEDLYNRRQPPLKTINPSYLDASTRPAEDFYQFANGKWLANQQGVSNRSTWDDSYALTVDNNAKLLTILMDTNKKEIAINHNLELIQTYYQSFYDYTYRKTQTEQKVATIKSTLASIQQKSELSKVLRLFAIQKINVLFEIKVGPCPKEAEENSLYFSQNKLSLKDKNLYTGDINNSIQKEYLAYISQLFELMNLKASEERALSVFNFEKELAAIHTYESNRSISVENYQTIEFEQAEDLLKYFDLEVFLKEANATRSKWVVLEQANYLKELKELYSNTELSVLKDYVTWKYIEHYAPFLDQSFAKHHTRFSNALVHSTLNTTPIAVSADTGFEKKTVKVHKPQDTDILEHIKGSLFQPVLSYEFSHRFFSKSDKIKIGQIIEGIYQSNREQIKSNSWMSEETKEIASKKLQTMTLKVGYSAITPTIKIPKLTADNCLKNIDICNEYALKMELQKLSLRSNSHAWSTPSFANRVQYNPINNSLEIPAGIIQAPFFDNIAGEVYNFGKIGVLIAHEITHAFDEAGSHFNEEGYRSDWWNSTDQAHFSTLNLQLGKTYSQFCPFKTHCIDEKQTANENIAELSGLAIAYHAYSKTMEFTSGKKLSGYTPSQAFFITYAQMQKSVYSERKLKSILKNEAYSPAKYRVNGTLMNFSAFQKAFDTEMGNKMWKSESEIPQIW